MMDNINIAGTETARLFSNAPYIYCGTPRRSADITEALRAYNPLTDCAYDPDPDDGLSEHICTVIAEDGEFDIETRDGEILFWSYELEEDDQLEEDTTLITLNASQAIDLAKGLLKAAGVDMSRVTL